MAKSDDTSPAGAGVRDSARAGGLPVVGGPSREDREFLEAERPISTREFLAALLEDRREDLAKMIVADDRLVKSRDPSGASAVLLAVYNGLDECLGILLRSDVPLDVFEATAVGRVERVRELLDAAPGLLRENSQDGFPLLSLAAFFGRTEVLALLLERGADPALPASNPTRVTPLHSAVAHRGEEASRAMARELLAAGADPDAQQAGGFGPLHGAAGKGDAVLVRALIEAGASLDLESDMGQTAAELAAERGHTDLSQLLEAGE